MNSSLTFDSFNQQILVCQDEAFTMAIYLVGDEELACQIVQEAVLRVYNDGNGTQPIDWQMLQEVIFSCRRAIRSLFGETIAIPGWEQLKCHEREALLLVDVLGKSYQDAAFILNSSRDEITQNVASGRRHLTRSIHPEMAPCVKGDPLLF